MKEEYYSQYYADHREELNEKHKAYNKAHREQRRRNQKARYDRLKAHGICVKCAKNPARKGYILCWDCALYFSVYNAERKARRGASL